MSGTASLEPVVVHRSTLRTWVISLLAIPAVVIGVDVLWRGRLVAWMTDRVFESDPQTLDTRDEIWAWALAVVGGAIVIWGLKELFFPAAVVRTDPEGIHIRLRGPLRRPTFLPWTSLFDIDAGTLEDDGEDLEVLIVAVKDPSLLPAHPWGGKRVDERTVALFATEWDRRAERVASTLVDHAMAAARGAHE